jgi:hypothetical protein
VPVTAGTAILNWKKPDPRLKDRDAEVARLAFVEGLGQKEIADRIAAQGYSPVTPDRIGQVLNAHSGRDRIIRFLAQAPESQVFTSKEIAIALSIDIARVQYVLDGLQKKNIVSFRDVRNGPDSSDHKTKIDIHLTRRARHSRIVMSAMGHPPAGSMPVAAVVNAKPGIEEPIDHPDIATIFEEPPPVGPQPGESGPGSDEDWGPTVTEQPTVVLPWFKGSLGGFPVIRDLRDRAIRAQKLNAAARILEEVGEDDMVLALMAKTEFSGLEAEVITLLRHFGEIE